MGHAELWNVGIDTQFERTGMIETSNMVSGELKKIAP
jgi:hypothetical protein